MTVTETQTTSLIGAPVKRVEDARLITGAAKFLDDIRIPGMVHAAILRSPYGHARIKGIDISAAEEAPGVVAVYTGKDFEDLPALPCAWQAGGIDNFVNTPRPLEIDRAKHTGAGVAVGARRNGRAHPPPFRRGAGGEVCRPERRGRSSRSSRMAG